VILCDTGPLVAAFNKADKDHVRCVEFLVSNWSRLVIPSLAVTEICHLPTRSGAGASAWPLSSAPPSLTTGSASLRSRRMTTGGWLFVGKELRADLQSSFRGVDADDIGEQAEVVDVPGPGGEGLHREDVAW
jgi:predicted nucleic acid-binding protein